MESAASVRDDHEVAAALQGAIGLLVRKMRQAHLPGELTLAALEQRGLIERRRDTEDGRRILLSISDAGRQMVNDRRGARAEQFAAAMRAAFTDAELGQLLAAAPLLERLAERL